METVEIKKDSKKVEISKDTIIIALTIALVIVSAIAICLACLGEGHGERGKYSREGMMGQYSQSERYFGDNNINPNDLEVQGDQNTTANQNTNVSPKPVSVNPVVPPATTPKTQ